MIASLQLKTEAVPAERTEEEPEERKGGQESRLGGTDKNIETAHSPEPGGAYDNL